LIILALIFMVIELLGTRFTKEKLYDSPIGQLTAIAVGTLTLPLTVMFSSFSLIRNYKISFRGAFGINLSSLSSAIRYAIVFLLSLLPIVFVANIAFLVLLNSIGYPVEPQTIVVAFMSKEMPIWQQIYLSFAAIVIAPIAEEILFRGICLTAALKHMTAKEAVILVSVFFAFIHQHPESSLSLFILAVSLSLAYLHSANILVPILMHSFFNAFQIITILSIRDIPGILPGGI